MERHAGNAMHQANAKSLKAQARPPQSSPLNVQVKLILIG